MLAAFAIAGLTSIDAGAVRLGGPLTALGGPGACLRDLGRVSVAAQRCGLALTGMQGASGLAVSPDGRNVYVAAAGSDALVTLVRGGEGRLRPPLRPSRRSCVQAQRRA
jgi:DNA-binding beta-propeller fold protein YncE